MSANLQFIGSIRTPYSTLKECPRNIQFDGPVCRIEVDDQYASELKGLNAGDSITLLYWLRYSGQTDTYKPAGDKDQNGTFAMRTPFRPNPIGVAVLPIESISHDVITVRGLDCLDGTRLIDIKPAIFKERL